MPLIDGVDPVAVALGVGEPLEHHARDAFADDDAVGAVVEGTAAPRRRQRVGLREAHEGDGAVGAVHRADEHHVGVAAAQLL